MINALRFIAEVQVGVILLAVRNVYRLNCLPNVHRECPHCGTVKICNDIFIWKDINTSNAMVYL